MGIVSSCFIPPSDEIEEEGVDSGLNQINKIILAQPKSQIYEIKVPSQEINYYNSQIEQKLKECGDHWFNLKLNVRIDRCSNVKPNVKPNTTFDLSRGKLASSYLYHFQISDKYLCPQFKPPFTSIFYRGVPYCTKFCIICEDHLSSQVFLPCGHLCLCLECSNEHYQSVDLLVCPMCSTPILVWDNYSKFGFEWENIS